VVGSVEVVAVRPGSGGVGGVPVGRPRGPYPDVPTADRVAKVNPPAGNVLMDRRRRPAKRWCRRG
jgi:hypothetical protein